MAMLINVPTIPVYKAMSLLPTVVNTNPKNNHREHSRLINAKQPCSSGAYTASCKFFFTRSASFGSSEQHLYTMQIAQAVFKRVRRAKFSRGSLVSHFLAPKIEQHDCHRHAIQLESKITNNLAASPEVRIKAKTPSRPVATDSTRVRCSRRSLLDVVGETKRVLVLQLIWFRN